jgi:hypothetical protein
LVRDYHLLTSIATLYGQIKDKFNPASRNAKAKEFLKQDRPAGCQFTLILSFLLFDLYHWLHKGNDKSKNPPPTAEQLKAYLIGKVVDTSLDDAEMKKAIMRDVLAKQYAALS